MLCKNLDPQIYFNQVLRQADWLPACLAGWLAGCTSPPYFCMLVAFSHTVYYLLTGPPVFLTHPNSHIVTVGMSVSLYCNVSGTVKSYIWEMRSTNGGSWSRISNSNGYKHDVRNIQQSKQYRCVAGNDAGAVTSKAVTIQILSKLIHLNKK